MAGLARMCRSDPAVRATLRRSILVPVTGLFRDPEQFELLGRLVPALLGLHGRSRSGLSVWSAGCSDGSELYSVVLMLQRLGVLEGSRLIGSDVSGERVDAGPAGWRWSGGTVRREASPVLRWERRDLLREPAAAGGHSTSCCAGTWPSISRRPPSGPCTPSSPRRCGPGGVLMLGRSEQPAGTRNTSA